MINRVTGFLLGIVVALAAMSLGAQGNRNFNTVTTYTPPTGTCNSSTWLRGDNSCQTNTAPTAANPTATMGTSAVNGSATTYMRSDASPAFPTAIAPTLTGAWVHNAQVTLGAAVVEATRTATATPVTVGSTDYHVCTNLSVAGAVAVNLPATPATGRILIIDDCKGDAATNNVTITPAAGNIDAGTTYKITTNFGSVVLNYTGTIWKTEASR